MPGERKTNRDEPRPTTRVPIAERRAHIVQKATELFLRDGYAFVSMDAIATAAGCSPSVLKKAFAAKASLFAAVLEPWAELLLDPEPKHVDEPPADFIAALHGFVGRFFQAIRKEKGRYHLICRGLLPEADAEEGLVVRTAILWAAGPLIWLLQAGQQVGIFRRFTHPQETALDWFRFLIGYTLIPGLPPEEPGEHPARIAETLLHGVLKMDV